MTTDERAGRIAEGDRGTAPSWWHRTHPVFTPLTGFFTGLVVIIVVPGGYAAVLSSIFGDLSKEQRYFPYVLVLLLIPLSLVALPRTRRFGRYMLLGMVITAVVVVAVAALTLWFLFSHDG